jgi:hypothetical protein
MTTTTDECGCTEVLGSANTPAADYISAVAAYVDAGCKPPICPPSCGTSQKGLCIISDAGYACAQ